MSINQLVDIVAEEIPDIEGPAPLPTRRAEGRPRPHKRQHHDPRAAQLGAVDGTCVRHGGCTARAVSEVDGARREQRA